MKKQTVKSKADRARRAALLNEVRAEQAATISDSSSETAARVFQQALQAIDGEIRGLIDGSIKPGKYGKVERIAYLAKQAATFAAEERKAAALEQKAGDRIGKAIVLAWARKLERAERAQLVRELQELDERRSSLGR